MFVIILPAAVSGLKANIGIEEQKQPADYFV
jgi:hypothetical protein